MIANPYFVANKDILAEGYFFTDFSATTDMNEMPDTRTGPNSGAFIDNRTFMNLIVHYSLRDGSLVDKIVFGQA
jgi:hypothetical protein